MKRTLQLILFGTLFSAVLQCVVTDSAAITLTECRGLALKRNLSVRSARADVQSAKASVLGARSAYLPRLSMSGWWTRYEEKSFFMQGGDFEIDDQSYRLSGNASLTLFDGMGRLSGYRASLARRTGATEALRSAAQEVAYETERLFVEALRSDALREVNEEAVRLSAEQLKKTRAMLDLGAATRADVFKAEVDHSNNQLALLRAKRDRRLATAGLASFVGLDPLEDLELLDDAPPAEDLPVLGDAVKAARASHPRLGTARAGVGAERWGVRSAQSGFFPSLNLWSGISYQDTEWSALNDERTEWSYGVSLDFTVFDGFLTTAGVRQARSSLLSSEAAVESAEREVVLGVHSAHLDVEIARESIGVAGSGVRSAEEDLRLAQERFKLGEGTILEVIDAQVNHTRARTSLVSATYDLRLAQAGLRRAMGSAVRSEPSP